MPYQFLEHTADVKFQASGNTLEEAFKQSVLALEETISGDEKVLGQEEKQISLKGTDLENLLYNFLEEFLVLLDSEDFIFSEVKDIEIDEENFTMKATILGDKATNYNFTNDVKAITYNEMFVKKEKDIWKTQVVLDV